MSRQRHCRVCRGYHNVDDAWPYECRAHYKPRGPRSDTIPTPMLALDSMDPLWHPSTGEYLDSKSAFRAVTKAHGGEEVGNETQTDNRVYDHCSDKDVGEAIQMVNQGYKPNASETASEGWT
ncbi:hypothetical protein [Shinella sp.]|uniref:hypothetical protein n=1 Tax=Shinella sp. TaxID=1870904 RepID=UPI003D2E7DCB